MKAAVVVVGWLAVGLVVGLRGRQRTWERVLAVAFWPLFLAGGEAVEADPVARLRAALPPGDPAAGLVDELARAIRRLQGRLARLDAALASIEVEGVPDPALAAARQRSRQLIIEARAREQAALDDARASIEEVATRLWLLRESGERNEIDALLQDLAGRLRASEEVAAEGGGIQPAPG